MMVLKICFEFKLNSGTDDKNKLPAELPISLIGVFLRDRAAAARCGGSNKQQNCISVLCSIVNKNHFSGGSDCSLRQPTLSPAGWLFKAGGSP
jgi:hypothetical protein